jgi:hypothetical protein
MIIAGIIARITDLRLPGFGKELLAAPLGDLT